MLVNARLPYILVDQVARWFWPLLVSVYARDPRCRDRCHNNTVHVARWSWLLIFWLRFTLDRLRITLSNRDRTRLYETFIITIILISERTLYISNIISAFVSFQTLSKSSTPTAPTTRAPFCRGQPGWRGSQISGKNINNMYIYYTSSDPKKKVAFVFLATESVSNLGNCIRIIKL
jgi:hypothetical protein